MLYGANVIVVVVLLGYSEQMSLLWWSVYAILHLCYCCGSLVMLYSANVIVVVILLGYSELMSLLWWSGYAILNYCHCCGGMLKLCLVIFIAVTKSHGLVRLYGHKVPGSIPGHSNTIMLAFLLSCNKCFLQCVACYKVLL